jgi:hypothetical protein
MIETARKKYPAIHFFVGDAEQFVLEEPVDAVFSNAALHWMAKPGKVIGCVCGWRPSNRQRSEPLKRMAHFCGSGEYQRCSFFCEGVLISRLISFQLLGNDPCRFARHGRSAEGSGEAR